MKTLIGLGLVLCLTAFSGGLIYAERPQCENAPFTPAGRACFYDLAPYGYGWQLARCSPPAADGSLTCVTYLFLPNDFWLNKPDGTVFITLTDAAADLFVCQGPEAIACIIEYLYDNPAFPAPLPGMYAGKAKITSIGQMTPSYDTGCPTTIQGVGTVSDEAGRTYDLRDSLILIKNPGHADGCMEMLNDISLAPTR